jgi:hypothetical protein
LYIPIISAVVALIKKRQQKSILKMELEERLRHLLFCDFFADYQGGEEFASVYASIEREYVARGLSSVEVKKVYDSIGAICMNG